MKITKGKLRQIILEEIQNLVEQEQQRTGKGLSSDLDLEALRKAGRLKGEEDEASKELPQVVDSDPDHPKDQEE